MGNSEQPGPWPADDKASPVPLRRKRLKDELEEIGDERS